MAMAYSMKRRRFSYGGIPRTVPATRLFSGARRLMKYGQRGAVASRVHTFKRLGKILTIQSNGPSNPPLLNGQVATNPAAGLVIGNWSAGDVIGTVKFGIGMNFQAENIANFDEIKNLFDNYRIKYVRLRFDYSYNQAPAEGANGTKSNSLPLMHYTPDLDDANAPTQATVLESGWAKTGRLERTIYVTVKPRFQSGVSVSGGTAVAGGMGPSAMWLDSASPTIQHYGLKAFLTDVPVGSNNGNGQYEWTLRITPTYVIEGKNTV